MFTEEELSKAIKAKLTKNGKKLSMSQRTLDGMVNNHYQGVTEETDLDEFVTSVLPLYECVEGQLRHDNAEFVKQWENEHPKDTPNPDPNPEPTPKPTDETTKKLLERIEALEAEREAEKITQTISAKRAEIASKAKEKGLNNKEWMDSYLNGLAIDKNSDVDQMAESALQLFNMSKATVNPHVVPGAAGGGGEGDDNMFGDVAKMRK